MARKSAESYFTATFHDPWYRHKYGDVRYCIHCKKALPKSESAPDYSLGMPVFWVECKNNDRSGRWTWKELVCGREKQRQFLIDNDGWLYIVLGTGRMPKGKSAYLVPIRAWVEEIEPVLLDKNISSFGKVASLNKDGSCRVGSIGGDDLLSDWRLEWNKKFIIPKGHEFWHIYMDKLEESLKMVRECL